MPSEVVQAQKLGLHVVRTRREHNCCKCGALILVGSSVYAVTKDFHSVHGFNPVYSSRLFSVYYCGGCRPVGVKR